MFETAPSQIKLEELMRIINKFACAIAAAALLSANLSETAAEAKPKPRYRQHAHHRLHRFSNPDRSGSRRSVDGDLIDRNGWRLRDGKWDNTCFNLAYLPSQVACGTYGDGGSPQ
jgi:hypothetical protein